ncbi:uncharacterized protein L199_006887 [Kwoniella botswanensis]|uniref:uncharacterized protein n=1 Tax=Kwoniella botswanensis TaxID=1268659 RepID=UPI00315CE849
MSRVPSVIQAPTPAHVQTYYCTHTRSNRSNIEATIGWSQVLGGQDLRSAITGDQDTILEAARKSESAGCQAFIKGTERTTGLSPHHLGVFFRASEIHTPWVTNDTLQPHSNKRVAAARRQCMLGLCLAIDAVVKEKVQARLDQVDRKTCLAHKASNDRFRSAVDQGKLDLRGLSPSDFQDVQVDHVADFFRFGQLATCSAITQGQSEKLHMDNHDDRRLYTTLLVLGRENLDWDHTDGRGDLLLPTLGLALPVFPGDVVFFQPGLLPHRVVALKPEDAKKRVVITMFTCEPTTDYLDMQGIMLPRAKRSWKPRSGQDTCPKCDKTYKDLLDHIKKKHGEDRFTAEEMAETGLWVCSCGKVTASERGLSYHRKRYPSHHV